MKAQVTIDYTDEKPVIDTILMSIQHDDDFLMKQNLKNSLKKTLWMPLLKNMI